MSSPPQSHADTQEQTLSQVLHSVALRASDTQLVVVCAVSLLGGTAILLFAPSWWRFSLPLASLACFSLWAIAERDGSQRRAVRAGKSVAAVLGVISAFGFALGILTRALGTWIS